LVFDISVASEMAMQRREEILVIDFPPVSIDSAVRRMCSAGEDQWEQVPSQ